MIFIFYIFVTFSWASAFDKLSDDLRDALQFKSNPLAQPLAETMINKINGRSGKIKKKLVRDDKRQKYFEAMMNFAIAFADPSFKIKNEQKRRYVSLTYNKVVTDLESFVMRYGEDVRYDQLGHLCGLLTAMLAGVKKIERPAHTTESLAKEIAEDFDFIKIGRSPDISATLGRANHLVIKRFLDMDGSFEKAWDKIQAQMPKEQNWTPKQELLLNQPKVDDLHGFRLNAQQEYDPRVIKASHSKWDEVVQVTFFKPATQNSSSGTGAIAHIDNQRIILTTGHLDKGYREFGYVRTNEYKNTDTTKIFYFLNFADKLIQPLKNQLKLVGDNEAIRAFIMYQWEVDLSFAICPNDFEPQKKGYHIVTKEFSLKDDNSKFIHVGYGKTHDPFDGKDLNDHKRRYYSGILQFKAPLKGEPNNSNVFYIPVLMSKFAEKMMVPPENLPMTGYESKPVEGNSGGPFFDDDDNIFGVLRNGNQESLDVPIYDDFGEFVRMGREEVDCSGINPISPLIYDTMKKVIGRMKVLFTKKNDVNQLPYNDQEIDKIFTEALEKMVNKDGADIVRQRYKDFMKSYKPK